MPKNDPLTPPNKSPDGPAIGVTKSSIAMVVADCFNLDVKDVIDAQSIHDIVHQSIDQIELVCALEDHFQIQLTLEDAEQLSSWDHAIAFLQQKVDQIIL